MSFIGQGHCHIYGKFRFAAAKVPYDNRKTRGIYPIIHGVNSSFIGESIKILESVPLFRHVKRIDFLILKYCCTLDLSVHCIMTIWYLYYTLNRRPSQDRFK